MGTSRPQYDASSRIRNMLATPSLSSYVSYNVTLMLKERATMTARKDSLFSCTVDHTEALSWE
jgi:hypothetical protein